MTGAPAFIVRAALLALVLYPAARYGWTYLIGAVMGAMLVVLIGDTRRARA